MMANLMTIQSHPGFPYREPDMDHQMADMANLYGTQDGWPPFSDFTGSNTPAARGHFNLNSNFQQERSQNRNNKRSHDVAADTQQAYADCGSAPGANLSIVTSQQYSSPSMFTPTNASANSQNITTISPMQTRFDNDEVSAASNENFPYSQRFQSSSPPQTISFPTEQQDSSSKRRRDSLHTSMMDNSSPTTSQSSNGRKRRLEYAEPGSARAVYLEKNRKAASKCRSKQKMQQEELVETARDVERRNRALKAEVEFLRSGMRDLMEIVGHHTACPDSRLRTYVQREADRLATDGVRTQQHQHQHKQPHQHQQQFLKSESEGSDAAPMGHE